MQDSLLCVGFLLTLRMKFFFALAMLVMGCSDGKRAKEVVMGCSDGKRAKEVVTALIKLPSDAPQEERAKVCKDLIENASESQAKKYAVEISFEELASSGAPSMSSDEKQLAKAAMETFIGLAYTECVSLV